MRAIFVPTVKEAENIFGSLHFNEYKFGIIQSSYNGIPVFITSVTKSAAAFAAGVVLSDGHIEEALLTGICGAYKNSGLSIGDIVSIRKDFFADEAVFYDDRMDSLHDLGFRISDGGFSMFEPVTNIPITNSNTVSYLDGTDRVSSMMQKKTGASVENMEGAAFGYACNSMGIKAYHVRAVSNFCGRRDEQQWNIKLAFSNLKRFFEYEYKSSL